MNKKLQRKILMLVCLLIVLVQSNLTTSAQSAGDKVIVNNDAGNKAVEGVVLDSSLSHAKIAIKNLHLFWTNLVIQVPTGKVRLTPANPLNSIDNVEDIGGIYAFAGVIAPGQQAVWNVEFDTTKPSEQVIIATPTLRKGGPLAPTLSLISIALKMLNADISPKSAPALINAVNVALKSTEIAGAVQSIDNQDPLGAAKHFYKMLTNEAQLAFLQQALGILGVQVGIEVLKNLAVAVNIVLLSQMVGDIILTLVQGTAVGSVAFKTFLHTPTPSLPPPTPSLSPPTQTSTPGVTPSATPSSQVPVVTPSQVPVTTSLGPGPVMAFYYPWYEPDDWNSGKMSDTANPTYSGGDDDAMRRHIQQADDAGIDALICAWYGPNEDRINKRCHRLLQLVQDSGRHIRVVVFPDPASFVELYTPGKMVEALDVIRKEFTSSPAYFTWQGKPVIFFYHPQSLGAAQDWMQLRDQSDPNRDQLWFGGTDDFSYLDIYDALYYFDISWEKADGAAMASYGNRLKTYNKSHNTNKPFIATVQPGYDDTLYRGQGHVVRDRANGDYYRGTWKTAISRRAAAVVLTSFNEFYEGSYIEPSAKFGDQYLQLTKELIAQYR